MKKCVGEGLFSMGRITGVILPRDPLPPPEDNVTAAFHGCHKCNVGQKIRGRPSQKTPRCLNKTSKFDVWRYLPRHSQTAKKACAN